MVQPIKFSGRESITSYDFNDLAAGTGIQLFYGGIHAYRTVGNLIISAAVLSDNTFYSDEIVRTKIIATSLSNELIQSLDLNLKFNTTRIVNGNILVNVPLGFIHPAGGGNNFTFGTFSLNKVVGSTTTFIQSGMTSLIGSTSTTTSAYVNNFCMSFTVSAMTFSKDDTLRLTVDQYSQGGAGASGIVYGIGVDPMNRNDTATNKPIPDTSDSSLIVQVPFKLEVD